MIYEYIWIGLCLAFFLSSALVVRSRGLFRPGPMLLLFLATGLGWWLRVETYLLFLHIMSFAGLERFFLLGAMVFGTVFLLVCIFMFLSLFNLLFPRKLRAGDMFFLSALGSFALSLAAMLYGLGKAAGRSLGLF